MTWSDDGRTWLEPLPPRPPLPKIVAWQDELVEATAKLAKIRAIVDIHSDLCCECDLAEEIEKVLDGYA